MSIDSVLEVVAAVIIDDEKVLLMKRQGGYLDGLWEFPGGKVEQNETYFNAITREIKEELNILVKPRLLLFSLKHFYPDKVIKLSFIKCALDPDLEQVISSQYENTWFEFSQLHNLSLCPADRRAFNRMIRKKIFDSE